MNPSEKLPQELEACVDSLAATLFSIQQQLVIDALDYLFRRFEAFGIPGDSVLMGVQTALENYGISVIDADNLRPNTIPYPLVQASPENN